MARTALCQYCALVYSPRGEHDVVGISENKGSSDTELCGVIEPANHVHTDRAYNDARRTFPVVEQLSCELDGPFVRRPPEHRLCDIEPIFGQLHRLDEVLPVPEIHRRAGVGGGRIDQIAVRSDQRELNHVAAGHLRLLGPEFQAEGGRILCVKRARDQQ